MPYRYWTEVRYCPACGSVVDVQMTGNASQRDPSNARTQDATGLDEAGHPFN